MCSTGLCVQPGPAPSPALPALPDTTRAGSGAPGNPLIPALHPQAPQTPGVGQLSDQCRDLTGLIRRCSLTTALSWLHLWSGFGLCVGVFQCWGCSHACSASSSFPHERTGKISAISRRGTGQTPVPSLARDPPWDGAACPTCPHSSCTEFLPFWTPSPAPLSF